MQLTEHFTLEEMLHSETAEKKKIENRITAEEVNNLQKLCQKVLEPLRQHFGKPIRINSGFRCKALNDAVGGAKNSYHTKGTPKAAQLTSRCTQAGSPTSETICRIRN